MVGAVGFLALIVHEGVAFRGCASAKKRLWWGFVRSGSVLTYRRCSATVPTRWTGSHLREAGRGLGNRRMSVMSRSPVGCRAGLSDRPQKTRIPHGCPQEEDLQGEGPQPKGLCVADPSRRPQRVHPLRCRQTSAPRVRQLRVVSRPAGHRRRVADLSNASLHLPAHVLMRSDGTFVGVEWSEPPWNR